MPNRNQNPGQDQAQQKGRRNPATTMPDDDEAQEGDQTQRAGEQGGQQPGQQAGQQGLINDIDSAGAALGARKAQDRLRRRPWS